MLSWLLDGLRSKHRSPIDYDTAKEKARNQSTDVRLNLAKRQDVAPEILYYLAEDDEPLIRRQIAVNPATPHQADLLLARDIDETVRLELVRKIGRLMPGLPADQSDKLCTYAIELLQILARDALPKVRALVAEEIRDSRKVPHDLVLRLARDLESIVSAPILEYSPLLHERDLKEIIETNPASTILIAIANRHNLTMPITDQLAATPDTAAIAALLANQSAQIREETLDALVERASVEEHLQAPLVTRPELSIRTMRRISEFVSASLLSILADKHGLPADFVSEVRKKITQRLAEQESSEGSVDKLIERLNGLHASGLLDDSALCDIIDANQREGVIHALTLCSKLTPISVRKILTSKSPKGITALAWQGGFSMRTAIRLQMRIGGVAPNAILNARNGVDYPLTEDELTWQIDYFCR